MDSDPSPVRTVNRTPPRLLSDIDRIVGVVGVEDVGLVWGLSQFIPRWIAGMERLTASNPVRIGVQGGAQAIDGMIDALLAQVKEVVNPTPPVGVVNTGSFDPDTPIPGMPTMRPGAPTVPMPPVSRGNSPYYPWNEDV